MDLNVSPELIIPAAELAWKFSRSSGPGGQHVNKTETRVELSWNITGSLAISEEQRDNISARLAARLIAGTLIVTASEHRSQLRNREIALNKMAKILAQALAPQGPQRRASKASRSSRRRHQAAKQQRSATKQLRQRPSAD
ncbi:alternative ribosome rescue aminoacyl-tRNA hydrolase ArfB [Arthrobacter cryoconiti]|uniref:Alternative ribosome rescue aminoacyl-tRNA hydrolase ArfB n=1 Tax=Arthrobacter cryoconiti TaxID=748907 RepID=A0ABV8QW68_9MICC|nr:alternative ribosome rescue aminoacyl-tRNA hydrolase ArfB [Arthrobacter cryoconiti]MCC9069667.1 aminoacyl-tRNA hydrolase [Arthrobacter cryoconiti]